LAAIFPSSLKGSQPLLCDSGPPGPIVQHASLYPFGANVITELPPRHQWIHECLPRPALPSGTVSTTRVKVRPIEIQENLRFKHVICREASTVPNHGRNLCFSARINLKRAHESYQAPTKVEAHTRQDEVVETHRRTPKRSLTKVDHYPPYSTIFCHRAVYAK